jgi:hypothetical protein
MPGSLAHNETQRHVPRVTLTPTNKVKHALGLCSLHVLQLRIDFILKIVQEFAMMQHLLNPVIHWRNVSAQQFINTPVHFFLDD